MASAGLFHSYSLDGDDGFRIGGGVDVRKEEVSQGRDREGRRVILAGGGGGGGGGGGCVFIECRGCERFGQ